MSDLKTALAGLEWFAKLGLPADLLTAARTELQTRAATVAAPAPGASPIPSGPPGGPKPAAPHPSGDKILAKAAEAHKTIEDVYDNYTTQRSATASTEAITGSVADIGPQIDAARKDVHKAARDAKHAVHTGNLAEAAKLAADAAEAADKAMALERKWEGDLEDKLAFTKTVVIKTKWGDIQHLEEQSKMVNPLAAGLMRQADWEDKGKSKVVEKLNEIEDATKPMEALLKDPAAAGAQVAASASAHKDKMLRAATSAELASMDKKIENIRSMLDTIMSDQIETAQTQYEAAMAMLKAQAKDDEASKLLSDFEKHKARWDILKTTAMNLAKLVATGGEGIIEVVKDEATELFKYFHENRVKEQAEDLQAEAGKIRNEAFNALIAKATATVQKLGIALDSLQKQIEEDDADAIRHVNTATTEFDANCGDCKVKFKDIEAAIKLVQDAQKLAMERIRNLDGMEQTLEQIEKELKMTSRDAPSGQFYESHNGLIFSTIYTDIVTHRDDASRQSSHVDQLMPPLAKLFKSAFSSLKI